MASQNIVFIDDWGTVFMLMQRIQDTHHCVMVSLFCPFYIVFDILSYMFIHDCCICKPNSVAWFWNGAKVSSLWGVEVFCISFTSSTFCCIFKVKQLSLHCWQFFRKHKFLYVMQLWDYFTLRYITIWIYHDLFFQSRDIVV